MENRFDLLKYFLIILSFIIVSCENNEQIESFEGDVKVVKLLNRGNIYKEYRYYTDSFIDYSVITYYRNKNIKSVFNYKNDSLFGPSEEFFRNGNLRKTGLWDKNELYGEQFESYNYPGDTILYPINEEDSEIRILMGKIKKYECYDLNGNLAFYTIYKKDGTIREKSDFSIVEVNRIAEHAKVNFPYIMLIYIPDPPYTETELEITKLNKGSDQEKEIEYKFSETGGEIEISPIFEESGSCYIKLITKIRYLPDNISLIDTSYIDVIVD